MNYIDRNTTEGKLKLKKEILEKKEKERQKRPPADKKESFALSIDDYKPNMRRSSRDYTPRQESTTEEVATLGDRTVGYIRFQNNNPSQKNVQKINSYNLQYSDPDLVIQEHSPDDSNQLQESSFHFNKNLAESLANSDVSPQGLAKFSREIDFRQTNDTMTRISSGHNRMNTESQLKVLEENTNSA